MFYLFGATTTSSPVPGFKSGPGTVIVPSGLIMFPFGSMTVPSGFTTLPFGALIVPFGVVTVPPFGKLISPSGVICEPSPSTVTSSPVLISPSTPGIVILPSGFGFNVGLSPVVSLLSGTVTVPSG